MDQKDHLNSSDNDLLELTLKADHFMLIMLWLHLIIVSLASLSYGTWKEGLVASLFICFIGTISYITSKGTFGHRLLNGLLILSYSVILISVQYGRIEMHFHVFAALPLLLLYKDWRIIPPAALLTALHHSIFNYCQQNSIRIFDFPLIVFNYASGWDIVFLHGIFVICQTIILIYYSKVLRKSYLEVTQANKNLEAKVQIRTENLLKEKEQIEAYKKALDKVAITELTDKQGRIIEVNGNFEIASEYSKEELVGRTHQVLNSGQHSKSFFKKMWKTINRGDVWRGEIKNTTRNGHFFWSDTAITAIKDTSGDVKNFIAIRFDITDKKDNEETILKQQEQIVSQSKLSALGEMAGGIAHEINNPLAIISASTQMIRKMIKKDMVKTEKFQNALDDIDKTIIRITKIVTGLRNVSRDTTNENFDNCSVDELLEDVLPLCSERFISNGIGLSVHISDELKSISLKVMRVQISQVLLNLLTNAFDELVTSEEKERWVKIDVSTQDSTVIIKVSDSGLGIPPEIQEKIFQPFFTTKDIGKGTGLGLSLSNSIIKKHNGKFYVDNNSKNTCFVIEIPIYSLGEPSFNKSESTSETSI